MRIRLLNHVFSMQAIQIYFLIKKGSVAFITDLIKVTNLYGLLSDYIIWYDFEICSFL